MTDPRAGDVDEAERLLAEACDQGAVRLPTLSRAELWTLSGDQQVLMDDGEARWWAALTESDRETLVTAMIDLLVDRGLLRRPEPSSALAGSAGHGAAVPGWAGTGRAESDWAGPALPDPDWGRQKLPMTPALAMIVVAMQAPAVVAVATAEDGSPEGAPRIFGLAEGTMPPRAVVAEILSDNSAGPFGRLHHFSLLSVSRAGHALATWAAEGSRGRLIGRRGRQGPARIIDVYRYSADERLSREHLVISPAGAGRHEVTRQSLEGESRPPAICDTEAVARLLTGLLRIDGG